MRPVEGAEPLKEMIELIPNPQVVLEHQEARKDTSVAEVPPEKV